MTRKGKIARLPHTIREQLNRRFRDGEQGKKLAAWLNSLPHVQTMLATEFGGQPITPQSLSEWKKGGYRDWQLQQETKELIPVLAAEASEFQAATSKPLSDVLALWLTAQCMVAAKHLPRTGRWKNLREMCGHVVELRKGDHSAERLKLERERLEHEREAVRKVREEEFRAWAEEHSEEICRDYKTYEERTSLLFKAIFGDDMELESSGEGKSPDCACAAPADPTKSDQIRPNQTSFSGGESLTDGKSGAMTENGQPNPTESNPIKPDQTSEASS